MDKPPPDDFDPTQLIDDTYQMQNPRNRGDEDHDRNRAPDRPTDDEDILPPFLHRLIPPRFRKALFSGSCCAGVVALYAISAWDHGLMPGVESPFAKADMQSDFAEMYTLSLARAIRDLSLDNCTAQSKAVADQIEALRLKYEARSRREYPHTVCAQVIGQRY